METFFVVVNSGPQLHFKPKDALEQWPKTYVVVYAMHTEEGFFCVPEYHHGLHYPVKLSWK